jgi:hypothetical protein
MNSKSFVLSKFHHQNTRGNDRLGSLISQICKACPVVAAPLFEGVSIGRSHFDGLSDRDHVKIAQKIETGAATTGQAL